MLKTIILSLIFLFSCHSIQAEEILQPFGPGSYQQLLDNKANKDLLVVFWSVTCPPCMRELEDLGKFHIQYPEHQLSLINTDLSSDKRELNAILKSHGLSDLDNWIFASNNEEQLRYEIDPRWYGDLPRSYFFSTQGKHQRLRGALSKEKMQSLFVNKTDFASQ